jgi:hypothetical protein
MSVRAGAAPSSSTRRPLPPPQGNNDEPVTLRLEQLAPLSNLQVAGAGSAIPTCLRPPAALATAQRYQPSSFQPTPPHPPRPTQGPAHRQAALLLPRPPPPGGGVRAHPRRRRRHRRARGRVRAAAQPAAVPRRGRDDARGPGAAEPLLPAGQVGRAGGGRAQGCVGLPPRSAPQPAAASNRPPRPRAPPPPPPACRCRPRRSAAARTRCRWRSRTCRPGSLGWS